jgi:hypothetical protein
VHTLVTFIPAPHLDGVKQALFNAGAGKIGFYDQCCWQVLGEGQFRPLPGSVPFVGEQNSLQFEPEYRVEMLCEDHCLDAVIAALIAAHPYEEPAWSAWPVRTK